MTIDYTLPVSVKGMSREALRRELWRELEVFARKPEEILPLVERSAISDEVRGADFSRFIRRTRFHSGQEFTERVTLSSNDSAVFLWPQGRMVLTVSIEERGAGLALRFLYEGAGAGLAHAAMEKLRRDAYRAKDEEAVRTMAGRIEGRRVHARPQKTQETP